jgi:hypothetical protein
MNRDYCPYIIMCKHTKEQLRTTSPTLQTLVTFQSFCNSQEHTTCDYYERLHQYYASGISCLRKSRLCERLGNPNDKNWGQL